MNFVTKELHNGQWIPTHFKTMLEAKALMKKIMKQGGAAICLKS